MYRRREPDRPETPPECEFWLAPRVADPGTGQRPGADTRRDTGYHRSRSCAVLEDGTIMPDVAGTGPLPQVHGRRILSLTGPPADRAAVRRTSEPLDAFQSEQLFRLSRSFARRVASS